VYAPQAYGALPPGAVPYPPPGYPVVQAAAPPAPRPPAAPPVRTAQASAPKPPVVRGQAPDDVTPPARATVAMPSPGQLGVSAKLADGAADWVAIHKRLQELGVGTFQVDRLNAEVFQFTCLLPAAEAGKTHRIEAHGNTEAEAARRALDEAQRWRDQRQ